MEERRNDLPEEEKTEVKSQWQSTKEGWYDKIPLTLKQLDIIIFCGFAGMVILAIVIALDAMGIWSPFG